MSRAGFNRSHNDILNAHVSARLNQGKFVAVDIHSGDYEIDADDYQATGRLMARLPAARIWLLRAGQPTTYRMARAEAGDCDAAMKAACEREDYDFNAYQCQREYDLQHAKDHLPSSWWLPV
jgi:hypothetical protein